MRVHFRGIVLGVGVLLSVVIVISIFNAFDSPPERMQARSRNALSDGSEEEAGQSPSRTSPRSSTRLRPQGGARGARAGGAGGRAGGPGGPRAGGAGGRAGGPGGPRGRAGRMGGAAAARGGDMDEEEGEEEIDIDETPTEEVEEEEPRGRAGFAGRNRMGGAAARGRASDDDDEQILARGAAARRTPVSRRQDSKRKAKEEEGEEDEEKEEEKEKKEEEKKEEKPPEPPKKLEPPYPDWWKQSYPRSAVSGMEEQLVGDQPLFPECPNFEVGASNLKIKRYGFVDPPHFLKNSKNPCWFEWNGKKDILKCIPYFYIAGAPKSGTADLLHRVQGHPTVMEGGATAYYWWDRLRYGASRTLKYTREAKRSDDIVQLKEYAKNVVGKQGKNLTKQILYAGKSESIFGDASPTYLTENTQWDVFEANDGCSEPRVIPATFIRHIFPDCRIVILLRDPIERLYSRFLANVPYVYEYENLTSTLFHTFVSQAVQSYRECFSILSIRHCAYNTTLFTTSVVRLSEGMYSVFLEDWFRIFPREQILVLNFEEYVQDVQSHINKVFVHLGVDPVDDYSSQKLAELPIVRKGRVREEAGYMLPETVALLKEFYTPFNLKLADMLQDDKWLFPRDDSLLTVAAAAPAVPVPVAGTNIAVAPPPANGNIAPAAPNEPPAEIQKVESIPEKEPETAGRETEEGGEELEKDEAANEEAL